VDLWRDRERDEALGVVIDYKSSHKRLDPVLVAAGVQLQLAAYLAVLRHWPDPRELAGVSRLIPAGVFYVNLRGKYERGQNRTETLAGAEQARKLAYRHTGRFDVRALRKLDRRPYAKQGDQFNYRITKDGQIHKGSREALEPAEFEVMLDAIETSLKQMGQAIYAGVARVDPYRKGQSTACDQCDYQSICHIDPWTHHFRALKKKENNTSE
jgi:ATP-dependent helicase/nuclease subunit B